MTIARLGGFALLGSSEVTWALKPGIMPFTTSFDMEPQHAQALFNSTAMAKKPTSLTITNEVTGKTKTFTNLWVLRLAPAENKNILRVVVADRRWMWSNALVCRGYNMRRHVGVKIATASDQPATNPIVPKYAYKRWSLKTPAGEPPSAKWTPKDVIEDVFKEVSKIEELHSGSGFKPEIRSSIGDAIKSLPVEDLLIYDPGDQAVARALGAFTEADVCLDEDGKVIVYSRVDGSDTDIVKMLGPEIVGRGHFEFITQSAMRPAYYEIYFQIESEIRLDYAENAAARGSTVTEDSDEFKVDNVAPVPDYKLPVGAAVGDANVFPQGTWLTMDQLFNMWGNFPDPFGGGGKQLDHAMVQKAFMPFNDLWSKMGLIGSFSPDADWGPRLATVHGHYRTTFRMYSRLMDRIVDWHPYRVATIDRTSGQRAPAMWWGDYAVLNNVRACFKRRGQSFAYALNKTGYPASGIIDSGASPAPARVKQEDKDQGILHVDYFDPFGIYKTFFPSKIDQATMPHGDIGRKGTQYVLFDSIGEPGQPLPKLSASMRGATIVTAIPGSPNNLNRYYKIKVMPDDVKDIIPGGQKTVAGCYGPPMRILIGPGVETARIQWLDSRAADIKRIFGVGGDGDPNLDGLVINLGDPKDSGSVGNSVSLWALAKAEAARNWALYADRYLGDGTGDFTPGLLPTGYVESVTHSVTTAGEVVTKVALKEKLPQFPLESLLSSSARAILNKAPMP